jgi:lipid II:glycine glycyltransferase (peptidoglycan interpeptide bridge formation enzyme)
MISFVKRAALDVEKYDSCIENSIQSRIYAFSWYLDIVADHWDVLVLNDYEAVMPLPWKQKFGLKYITQPYFCQQLGIFSVEKISKEIQLQFIKKIPLQFLKVALVLNSQNMLIGQPIKKNLFLQLNKNHELLRKKFSKGRKHAIKVAEKNQLMVAETSIQSLIDIQKKLYQYEFSEKKLIKLSKQVLQQNTGEVVGVFKDEVLLGGAFFLFQKERIVYLFSAFTEKGRELQAASFLLNYMLKKNENSLLIFDFEGGNISNIATFYNSFGAEVETYSLVTRILL